MTASVEVSMILSTIAVYPKYRLKNLFVILQNDVIHS